MSRDVRQLPLFLVLGLSVVSAVLGLPSASRGGGNADVAAQAPVPRFSWTGRTGFGESVAVSQNGRTVVVGDPRWDRLSTTKVGPGAAWVLTHRGASEQWERQRLTGNVNSNIGFGTSVAVSSNGQFVLVGAPFENRTTGAGAAWIFRRSGGGVWVGQKLRGTGGRQSHFGSSVALSANGSTAIVGAFRDDKEKGAAWVFVRKGLTWRQQGGKLTKGGDLGADRFGWSVALSADGDLALIGGPRDRDDAGAVWSFRRSGGKWRQLGNKLTAPAGAPSPAFFGRDVALGGDGGIALVGANSVAFVFTRSGSEWRRRPRLPGFGRAVALSADGRTAAIRASGSYVEDRWRYDVRAFLYSCSSLGCSTTGERLSVPRQAEELNASSVPDTEDLAVANDGDTVAVAAPGNATNGRQETAGKVWAFLRWPFVKLLRPAQGPTSGGTEVAISGENFTKVRQVFFGSTPASAFIVDSATRIRATSPPGSGSVRVKVLTSVGLSPDAAGGWGSPLDLFTYIARPAVTAIAPTSGPTGGGTEVTITGSNFVRDASTVRFGARAASSVTYVSATQLKAVSPPAPAGTVDVTVSTAGGISEMGTQSRFTYVSPVVERRIDFDDLSTGGPGGAGTLTVVTNQYASQGLTFNNPSAIDYSKGASAIPGFARSGSIAIEQCVGIEFCSTPIVATFSSAKTLVRVWVGFSFPLNQPLQVQLTAYAGTSVVGTANATLPANSSPTPISTPLEVQVGTASITRLEVSVPGGYTGALAADDVTFQP